MKLKPACRHCGEPLTQTFVDLGLSPLANSYVPLDRPTKPCSRYPLHARVCSQCLLVQVEDAVPASAIFSDQYAYFSSFSDSWLEHCKVFAQSAIKRFNLNENDLVIEIASNDGYLLQYFVQAGIKVLGIEPTANTASVAIAKGVPTLIEFFNFPLAARLKGEGIRPRLICSANVLAHVPDINDFVRGISELLQGDSVYTVEFPHLKNLIEQVQFDTIYHEHYTYLSLVFLERLFAKCGLRVFDVNKLQTHGGSLRLYVCKTTATYEESPSVAATRAEEAAVGLDKASGYKGFSDKVSAVKAGLQNFLASAKSEGKVVAAYGAAAKGNTLLNFCEVGPSEIAYCVDRNPAKQNTLLPGSHIPVYPISKLTESPPDFLLILPWNLRSEISEQLKSLRESGTRFVIPLPALEIF